MGRSHRTYARRARLMAGVFAVLAVLVGPAGAVSAHPLGNFTINHYAGVRIEPDRILLDVVIDEAEIPAFQSRQAIDLDEDSELADQELRDGARARCLELVDGLALSVGDGPTLSLRLDAAGLSFPLGASGLATLRLVCVYSTPLPAPIAADVPTRVAFVDTSRQDRLGWREVVVVGDGVAVSAVEGELRATSPSARLTAYPSDLLAQPLVDGRVVVETLADPSVSAPPFAVADAEPVDDGVQTPSPGAPADTSSPAPSASPSASASASASAAAVPGGIGGELPTIFNEADLTPVVVLLSLVTAAALGAGHALTPGHGKTLMAAYLVGTRGTSVHALGLGLSVSISHTVGILVLAGIVVGAADVLPPDLVVRTAPVIAAVSILAIGAWMLIGEWRRRRTADHEHAHEDSHGHPHPHEHAEAHDPHPHPHAEAHDAPDPGEHSHGGIRHSHLPAAGSTITWRSLFVLGLAGGLIPSVSALLILLGAIAAGRPAFGFVLVVAFGIGMAAVMAGIGLVMVLARERLDRLPGGAGMGRLRAVMPLAAAVLVFGFGLYLTAQALGGTVAL
ncbi:MAG: nickel/cobalt transporter [Candidatus Limnocylindrales bacterium]